MSLEESAALAVKVGLSGDCLYVMQDAAVQSAQAHKTRAL